MRVLYMIYAAFMIGQFVKHKHCSTDNSTAFKCVITPFSVSRNAFRLSRGPNSGEMGPVQLLQNLTQKKPPTM